MLYCITNFRVAFLANSAPGCMGFGRIAFIVALYSMVSQAPITDTTEAEKNRDERDDGIDDQK